MYTMSRRHDHEGAPAAASGASRGGARLRRPDVLAAAVALADAEGLDALSMRRLATELGVVPMALYKHVSDKEDLVAGIIDVVVDSYRLPDPELAWRPAVRARIVAAREALRAHPWLRGAIERATVRTPSVLAHMDAVAGDLRRGGLSYDLVHHAMHALGHRIWGFSPEAFSDGAAPSTTGRADAVHDPAAAAQLAAMAERFPHIVAIAVDTAQRNPAGACDLDAEFGFTLELLLDAVERLHATGWRSA